MSGINTPFPVDSEVLGLIGPIFGAFRCQDCFAQGIVKKDGTLDPSVTSLVVKFKDIALDSDKPLDVFSLQGRVSASAGVMSSKSSPATALAATFTSDGHVSSAVFGTIEPVTHTHKSIHALAGIHASFGPASASASAKTWRCTKVEIMDTRWTPQLFKYTTREDRANDEPFFCHDFTTGETYVKFQKKITKHWDSEKGYVHYVHRMTLMPDGMIVTHNTTGVMPSDVVVAQAEKMLRECNALLQSKIELIKWLEVARVERHKQRDKQVNAVFSWMHEFHKRQIQIPILMQRSSILRARSLIPDILAAGHSRSPAMSRFLLERAIYDPVNLYDPSNPMSRFIQPCKCTPMHHDPACKSDSCIFKNSSLLLTQEKYRQPIISRISRVERETSRLEKEREAAARLNVQRMRDKIANEKSKKGGSKKCKKTCKLKKTCKRR